MRLWSISPAYLDRQGLCGLWRESLLGQSCLIDGEYQDCPDCSLDKKYNGRLTPEIDNTSFRAWVNCPNCKGTGKIKTPYFNHPQLQRFKEQKEHDLLFLSAYLWEIWKEGQSRGYNFTWQKIWKHSRNIPKWIYGTIAVTKGQLEWEFKHLCRKVMKRDRDWFIKIKGQEFRDNYTIKANPIFKVVYGDIESWEKIKKGI